MGTWPPYKYVMDSNFQMCFWTINTGYLFTLTTVFQQIGHDLSDYHLKNKRYPVFMEIFAHYKLPMAIPWERTKHVLMNTSRYNAGATSSANVQSPLAGRRTFRHRGQYPGTLRDNVGWANRACKSRRRCAIILFYDTAKNRSPNSLGDRFVYIGYGILARNMRGWCTNKILLH